MKKIVLLLAVVAMTVLSGCSGADGAPGRDGYSAESEVFEVTTNFIPTNNLDTAYRSFFDLNPVILKSDNILVFELAGVVNGLDVWKLLPQVYTFSQGIMQYNYDFTSNDFSLFIDANFDRSTLGSSWTQNKIFRIVIVPGYFSKGTTLDTTNYQEVIKAFKIDDSHVVRLNQK